MGTARFEPRRVYRARIVGLYHDLKLLEAEFTAAVCASQGKRGGYVESISIDEMGADGDAESQQWMSGESTVAEGRERAASWLLGGVSAELA